MLQAKPSRTLPQRHIVEISNGDSTIKQFVSTVDASCNVQLPEPSTLSADAARRHLRQVGQSIAHLNTVADDGAPQVLKDYYSELAAALPEMQARAAKYAEARTQLVEALERKAEQLEIEAAEQLRSVLGDEAGKAASKALNLRKFLRDETLPPVEVPDSRILDETKNLKSRIKNL
jgi:hypothetical protein